MSQTHHETVLRKAAVVSGLVSPERLDYCLRVARHRQSQQGLAPDLEPPDNLLAEVMVEQNLVTSYQVHQLREGKTKLSLGPYLITDFIGQGGMGQVFQGVHNVMGRVCAVKVLPIGRITQETKDSFAHEVRMQAKLDCPYLVRAFDANQDGKVSYLVTEYVPGMDLRRLVKSQGPLPMQQAASVIMQAALGLDYAHKEGLVHRDVKPGNILVTPDGQAKVSDVGLAGFAADLVSGSRAGKIVGTADYISPEQIKTPLQVQSASDIYSLGCTLYYAVCGKVPFPGGDTKSKLRRHLEDLPLHPRNFAHDITEEFTDIIVDMMEKDPRKRISNAAEVASRLEPWADEAYLVTAVTMARSPWSAPPPPSHKEDDRPDWLHDSDSGNVIQEVIPDGALHDTGGESGPSSTLSTQQSSVSPHASMHAMSEESVPQPTPVVPLGNQRTGLGTGMVIALTVAIVVPPALLIGAILGYLAAKS